MTTRRLNMTVNTLRTYLIRHDVPSPDLVANLLLTAGKPCKGMTKLDDDNGINISSKGPFGAVIGKAVSATDLRAQLVKAGLITPKSYSDYNQWIGIPTAKLEKYKARYNAECQGFENPVLAMSAMEARVDKKLAKQSASNAALKAELVATQGLLAQNQGQLMAHESQLEAIWKAIKHIQENDAPVTEEKIQRHLRAV